MILPSFYVDTWYRLVFNNDQKVTGKFVGVKDQHVAKFNVTLHYLLFDVGTDEEDGESYPLIGHFQQDDIVSATLLKSVRPVASGHEMLWEETP